MAYAVALLPSAARALAKLPKDIQKRIARKIDALQNDPLPEGAKVLKSTDEFFRIRVGDYRVIYKIEKRRLVILVVKIGHRGNVYRNL